MNRAALFSGLAGTAIATLIFVVAGDLPAASIALATGAGFSIFMGWNESRNG